MPYCGSIIRLSIVDVILLLAIKLVLWACDMQIKSVYSYVCMHLWSGAGISLVSHPAMQAM